MAEDQDRHKGLSTIDVVLLVVGGLVAVWVAFAALHFIAGLVWFVIKVALVVGLVVLAARLLFRRH